MRFVFGLHLHQPVGNFDHVFENHAADVYRPLMRQLARRMVGPVLLHVSGPLIEWLERHDTALLDDMGRLVGDGLIEPLTGGMYEPILAAIPRADRVEQIGWHRERIRRLFGVDASGLWLTERVWEPELAADLADAGVEYVLVDDRHFLVSGYQRDELHTPFRTESNGRAVSVLAIDERLRYLIPFHEPTATAALLRSMHDAGAPLAVYADDGEKFGGWPGTKALVYDRGWFDAFCDTLSQLRDEGIVQMTTGRDALRAVPARGPAYLPTASYQEMETWALPPDAARRLMVLERDLGERMGGPDRAFIRGAHWRNFLARYTEANRLQKKMVALSALSRTRGDPPEARRAIARSQCNDAYWHGVFGGLYLPHLRAALWRELAIAECALRSGERLAAERVDIDHDGADEIWVHGAQFSAIVAPARGGAIVEWTQFATGVNHADTLTRRREAYHSPVLDAHRGETPQELAPSIHDLESGFGLAEPPPFDLDDRAIGVARVFPASLTLDDYVAGRFGPVASWARTRCDAAIESVDDRITVRCSAPGFSVVWTFAPDGAIEATWTWDPSRLGEGERFAPELTFAGAPDVDAPASVATWRHPVETYAKSERGLERVLQGECVTPLFDARSGSATVVLRGGAS